MAHSITPDCIGCGVCARSCPALAISGGDKEVHSIDPRLCIDCGVCGTVCPTGSIRDGEGQPLARVEAAKRPKPVIDTEACTACGLCVDICRFGALAIATPPAPDIPRAWVEAEHKKCVSCCLCRRECPTGAITMEVVYK